MIRKIVKWIVFKGIYPACYLIASGRTVQEKKVIFVENHQNYLTENYTLLYKELQKDGFDVHVHYLQVASSGWGKIVRRSLRLIWDMGTAAVVFLNESNSLFGAFTLRRETQMVQVWHACGAFKKWGFSVADKQFGDDAKELSRYSGHRNYTLVPVSGEKVCPAYREAFGVGKKKVVRPLGVSRTDVFFDGQYRKQAYERLLAWKPEWKHKKIILYLPTFRGSISQAKAPDILDWNCLGKLGDEYVFVIQNHPFIKKQMDIPENLSDKVLDVTGSEEPQLTTNEWMLVSHMCITDYSSVVFEYSLLEKPIFFLAYDLDEYYDERGFYYPYDEFVPGPILRNTEELLRAIENVKNYDYNKLKEFRKKYMSGCDGTSTKRILQEIYGNMLRKE